MKQTATEWLFEQVVNLDWGNLNGEQKIKILEQAKEMDKKQRIDDMYKMQIVDDVDCDGNVDFIFNNIEQYYKETYGK